MALPGGATDACCAEVGARGTDSTPVTEPRRRGRHRGGRRRRNEPFAIAELDAPRPEIVCLACEPGESDGQQCRTEEVKEDARWQLCVERQSERVAAWANDPQLAEAHRTARYHLYRAFVSREFAGDPQGSGKRVKLPNCFELYVRRMFPNPACCASKVCDYLRACEKAGHYVGLLTAEESKERKLKLWQDGWEPLWKDEYY